MTTNEDEVADLLRDVYDAALNPAAWPKVMRAVSQAVGGAVGALQVLDLKTEQITALVANDVPPEAIADYNGYYYSVCPRVPAGKAAGPGVLLEDGDILDERAMERHEFYAEFLAKFGWRHWTGLVMHAADGMQVSFNVHRPIGHGTATAPQRRLINVLVPHLDRALRLSIRLGEIEAERDAFAEPLERLGIAAFVLDRRGRVARCNRAADAMERAADGITTRDGRLVVMWPAAARRFEALVASAAGIAQGIPASLPGRGGSMLRAPRPSGKRDYELSITPLPRRDLGIGAEGPFVLVLARDPDGDATPTERLLRDLYGLSPQEAALARALTRGRTVEETASELGVTVNTARVYLRRIFRKTGTDRQVDLMRLLLRMLPR
jgi:DNA-binding CsgD family transcriptional regulator